VSFNGVGKSNNSFSGYTQPNETLSRKTVNEDLSVFTPKIPVIDDFTTKCMDIDGDGKGDVSHGRVVVDMIKGIAPNAEITEFNVYDDKTHAISNEKIEAAYNKILERTTKGEHFDGVNMSIGSETTIDKPDGTSVMLESSKTLTGISYKTNKHILRNNLFSAKTNIISVMEEVAKNTPIYVAAGNPENGTNYISQYALGKGVISVGAADSHGKPLEGYSAMCDKYGNPDHPVFLIMKENGRPSRDKDGNVLFDVNGDNKPDYTSADMADPSYSKKHVPGPFVNLIQGVSFSTPTVFMEDLKAKWQKQHKTQ